MIASLPDLWHVRCAFQDLDLTAEAADASMLSRSMHLRLPQDASSATYRENQMAASAASFTYAPYTRRASKLVPQHWVERYEREAGKFWDLFYQRHADRFFKDRHYLGEEWPELQVPACGEASVGEQGADVEEGDDGDDEGDDEGDDDGDGTALRALLDSARGGFRGVVPGEEDVELRMLEAGCGVGNTLFPLLRANPRLKAYGVEFSKTAVEIVQAHRLAAAGRVTAAVGDLTDGVLPSTLSECIGRCDVATLMFVLSAISPGEMMERAIDAAASALREGGYLLIRDYAEGDGAQRRLQATSEARPKQLDEAGRFFVRQDGTRAYYFETGELAAMVESRGLRTLRCEVTLRETTNRAKGLTIGRRYITATFQKLGVSRTHEAGASRDPARRSDADGRKDGAAPPSIVTQPAHAAREQPASAAKKAHPDLQPHPRASDLTKPSVVAQPGAQLPPAPRMGAAFAAVVKALRDSIESTIETERAESFTAR